MKIDRDRRTDAVREQSEQRLALALDAVGGGVFDWRIPTDEWVRSDSWYELTGFGREELAAWESEHGSIIHPDDVDGMEEAFQRHVRREADRYHYEFRIRHKSGQWRWLLGRGLIVERAADGSPLRMVGTDSDITERKQAEQELRENRALLKAVIEGTTDAIAVTDLDGRFVLVNPTVADWLGRPAEELVGRLEVECHPPATAARIVEDDRRVLAGENTGEFENTIVRDGTGVTYLAAKSVLRDQRGEPVGLIGVARDITYRKQAEEALRRAHDELEDRVNERTAALRESEARYSDLYDQAPDMYVSVDARTAKIIQCNQTLAAALGCSKDEIIGRPIFDLYHADCRKDAERAFQAFVETGEVHDAELQLRKSDGSPIDVSLSVSAVRDEDGRILYGRSCWRDITARKRADKALKEMNVALANAMPGIARLDIDGRYIEVNELYAGMMGCRADEMIGSAWKPTVHPDDHAAAIDAYERMLLEGKGEFEARGVRKDSTTFFKHVLLVKITDKQGATTGHHCFMRDISERKQAEQELNEFFTLSADMMCVASADGRFKRVNLAFTRSWATRTRRCWILRSSTSFTRTTARRRWRNSGA